MVLEWDQAGLITSFLGVREAMASACLSSTARKARTYPVGWRRYLVMRHLEIDQYEESGVKIFSRVYIPSLRSLQMYGAFEDLEPVLSSMAPLVTSRDWQVKEVTIIADDITEQRLANEALRNFMYTVAHSMTAVLRLILHGPLQACTVGHMTGCLVASRTLEHLELYFDGWYTTVQALLDAGWTGMPKIFPRDGACLWKHGARGWGESMGRVFVGGIHVPYRRVDDSREVHRARIDKVTDMPVDRPSLVVISHTVISKEACLESFRETGILQHFLVTKDGHLWQFVSVDARAWHAGVAFWGSLGRTGIPNHPDANDVNSHSFGSTLEGNGCTEPFADPQYVTLLGLLRELRDRFTIGGMNILGLSEVAWPPGRHEGPGQFFDWDRLEEYDDAFLSRRRLAQCMSELLPNGDAQENSSGVLNVAFREWGYGVGTLERHFMNRKSLVADRYLGPQQEHTEAQIELCARALVQWRRRFGSNL